MVKILKSNKREKKLKTNKQQRKHLDLVISINMLEVFYTNSSVKSQMVYGFARFGIYSYKPGILFMGQANSIAPDGTPHFAASHLGLFCLQREISWKNEIKMKNHS